jgi:long-chain acyl-CoA synthetase
MAMDDGHTQLTFAQLHAAVVQHADTLIQRHAPTTVFVDDQLSIIEQMVSFMGIIHSGRCAAVSDPDWPSAVRDSVKRELGTALTKRPPALSTLASHQAARASPKDFAATIYRGPKACVCA